MTMHQMCNMTILFCSSPTAQDYRLAGMMAHAVHINEGLHKSILANVRLIVREELNKSPGVGQGASAVGGRGTGREPSSEVPAEIEEMGWAERARQELGFTLPIRSKQHLLQVEHALNADKDVTLRKTVEFLLSVLRANKSHVKDNSKLSSTIGNALLGRFDFVADCVLEYKGEKDVNFSRNPEEILTREHAEYKDWQEGDDEENAVEMEGVKKKKKIYFYRCNLLQIARTVVKVYQLTLTNATRMRIFADSQKEKNKR
jgi:hypothetical protein